MKHKIFIGIDLPSQVKKRIAQRLEKWADLPVRWVKTDNFHITVSFIGYTEDEMVADICEKIPSVMEGVESFDVSLDKIVLAPDSQNPKMFWLAGDSSEELKNLKEKLDIALGMGEANMKSFSPHVSLGRIRAAKWNELEEKPLVNEKFLVSVPVDKIIVFESKVEGGRMVYYPLETCPLI